MGTAGAASSWSDVFADVPPVAPHERAPRILVVEDDFACQDALRMLLTESGYEVVVASDGRAGLDYLIHQRGPEPEMVLLDLMMPVMDGWEFLAVMKSYLRLGRIPVVLLSCHDPARRRLVPGAVSAALRKPYNADDLLATIRQCVGPGSSSEPPVPTASAA